MMDLKELKNNQYIKAVFLMGIFTFVFLGIEYLFVNRMSLFTSENQTVLSQNYALGVSFIGFLCYPLYRRMIKKEKVGYLVFIFMTIACLLMFSFVMNESLIFWSGMLCFLVLGILGSGTYYKANCLIENKAYLARTVGISYMVGIVLQFIDHNVMTSLLLEILFIITSLVVLGYLLSQQYIIQERSKEKTQSYQLPAILLIGMIILMSIVFSTLDNAVTLVHATGVFDIGQLPRILLAVSGVFAGFVFDFHSRKYMSLTMLCIMMLSTICMITIKFSKPFLLGLLIFYMTAGFFVVFFTSSFMELACYSGYPDLFSGLGRAINNMTAALMTNASLMFLSSNDYMMIIVVTILFFVLTSVVTFVYTIQRNHFLFHDEVVPQLSEEEILQMIQEEFSLTPRETEVFHYLVTTEESIQSIADMLYISKRTLERYISSLYQKTGSKTRVGLMNIYNQKTLS